MRLKMIGGTQESQDHARHCTGGSKQASTASSAQNPALRYQSDTRGNVAMNRPRRGAVRHGTLRNLAPSP